MSEIVRPRLNEEQMKEQIEAVKAIAELTARIKPYADKMHSKSVREAYQNSVKNLEVKNEKYSKEKTSLTEEEKEVMKKALAEFRAKKETEVSSSKNETGGNDEFKPEVSESNMGKKKGKNH